MSDSDGDEPVKLGTTGGEREFYGSIEERLKQAEEDGEGQKTLENIHTSNEYMEIDVSEVQHDKKKMLEEIERKRRARQIPVPTDDIEVKKILRQRGEPIFLFGEGPADRRTRLKDFLSRQDGAGKVQSARKAEGRDSDEMDIEVPKEETWYHRGPASLKTARHRIAAYSVPRARDRLKRERLENNVEDASKKKAFKQELQSKLRNISLVGSQNADTRPISYICYNADGTMLATSSWSGIAKVWNVNDCSEILPLRGHSTFIDCIDFHPQLRAPHELNLVTSSRDGIINLWNLESNDPIASLMNLESRVSRVKFHPSGEFIGACVHDNSWRLFDLHHEKEEVLFQEGHSKEVYSLGFQKDGALAATGSMDHFGRIWDLRTGRCIMFLSGHSGSILSLDWSPNGYHLVTGSEDNTARIWDVRARKSVYNIPAHTAIVSGVAYDPHSSNYLVTCSYDGTVKIWCQGSYQQLKVLEGHGQKVMGVTISPCPKQLQIATCSFDRTFKLWGLG